MSDNLISRQAAIDEIEYELETINSALDSITLDFNARERLRQRRGEAREILNSIQQLPSADRPQGKWFINDAGDAQCSICGEVENAFIYGTEDWYGRGESHFCPNCGSKMRGEHDD